jgi:predicted dithiol-disulfide oxidoreductase (DUF899 family)
VNAGERPFDAPLEPVAVVPRDAWLNARRELLAKEKAFTRARDELAAERRALPWEHIDTDYEFTTTEGSASLGELFDGRSQLVVYHFMWSGSDGMPCKHCSFWADSFDGNVVHLAARDVSFVAVTRAPLAELERYRARMGWGFRWVSSEGSDFNVDFGASFPEEDRSAPVYNFGTMVPGGADREAVTVFARDPEGAIYRTYATFARGIDLLNAAYNYLDLVPRGRGEVGRNSQYWVRRHDEY